MRHLRISYRWGLHALILVLFSALSLSFLSTVPAKAAPVVFFSESFETDGNGTRYGTVPLEFTDGSGDFFTRTDGSNIGSFVEYFGADGSFYFAAMDTNGEPPNATTVTLDITGIDITGQSNLSVEILVAEDDDGANQDWDADSRVRLQAQIDVGGYVDVICFAGQGATNTEPLLDTDCDGTGDSTALTPTFANFASVIAGTGNTLDLRVLIENLEAGDEDVAFDNIRVLGETTASDTTPPQVSSTTPADTATGVAVDANITIDFDETVNYPPGSFTVSCTSSGLIGFSLTTTSPSTTATLDPTGDFANGETCTVTVFATNVTDNAGNELDGDGDGTAGDNFTFSFDTAAATVITPIHEVQGGPGTYDPNPFTGIVEASPLDGLSVTIQGIVVGDHQEAGEFNGFFVQEEDADADIDPATSEGIFVFCGGGAICPNVSLGDLVTVTGAVDEFFSMTQIDNDNSDFNVTIESNGNPLPSPATVTLPVAIPATNITADPREAFEGMRVTVTTPLTVIEYFDFDRFGEIKVASGTRPYQYTHTNAPSVPGYTAWLEELVSRTLVIDDGSGLQNVDPKVYPAGFPANSFRGGDTVNNLEGVLNYSFDEWRVQVYDPSANAATDGDPLALTFTSVNTRPAAPNPVGGDIRLVSFNVLNYFNGDGAGGGFPTARGAETFGDFQRQNDKIVEALCALDADIIGLVELENDYDEIAVELIAGEELAQNLTSNCGRNYTLVDPGGNVGTDQIAVGFIYDSNVIDIAPGTTVEVLDDSDAGTVGFTTPLFTGPDTNRAALAATFEVIDNTNPSFGGVFTVAVNHFKSKGGSGSGGNADAGDGQGNWNLRRDRAALALVQWLGLNPTGTADPDYMIIGDINAYKQEDPIVTLETAGYTDLLESLIGVNAYGFLFDGQIGYLDYAMSNTDLTPQVTGISEWHINADEPDALDYSTEFNPPGWYAVNPYRSSDHDPVLVGLSLTVPDIPTVISVVDGNNDPLDGNSYTAPGPDTVEITFSETLTNATATDENNYLLLEAGPNGTFETVDCAGGLQGDDVLAAPPYNTSNYTDPITTLTVSPALPEGVYRLHICAALTDADDGLQLNDGADEIVNFTVLSVETPTVTSTITAGGLPLDGNVFNTTLNEIEIAFSLDVLPGTGPDGAGNENNYLLLEPGTNGAFETVDCAGGLVGDDGLVAPPYAGLTHDDPTDTTTLTLDPALGEGVYRLHICGTTSIVSAANPDIALNGGADEIVDFEIVLEEEPVDPVDPVDPTEPVEPTEPVTPAQPGQQIAPAQPEELGVDVLPATGETPAWADLIRAVIGLFAGE